MFLKGHFAWAGGNQRETSTPAVNDDDLDGDFETTENAWTAEDLFTYNSRLLMSMPAILSNPHCLAFFVQYLEQRQQLTLLKFYLDTEHFRTAALTQLERERKQTVTTALARSSAADGATAPQDESVDDEEQEEEHNSVPELKTLCDMSMGKPLTDDEKSQICAATHKQQWLNQARRKERSLYTADGGAGCDTSSGGDSECGSCATPAAQVSTASVRDAIAIYQKYLRAGSKHFVPLPVAIMSQISLLLCQRGCDEDDEDSSTGAMAEPISIACFAEAQEFVVQQLKREHLDAFRQSVFYCFYCIELIERSNARDYAGVPAAATEAEVLNICDVLHSELTLCLFMEFLAQNGERRVCLDFWTAAINFRQSCQQANMRQAGDAQADAMVIYERFFSLQASNRLWRSDQLRSHVEERICAAADQDVLRSFDLPLQLVASYLERRHLAAFLRSQLFQSYLNELKAHGHEENHNSVSSGAANSTTPLTSSGRRFSLRRSTSGHVGCESRAALRHRKTLSDCSTTNTLLAMDSSGGAAHIRHIQTAAGGTSLNIDARQLTNPQLLWRRASSGSAGGLKFGHINALGRYERDFQTVDASYAGTGSGKTALTPTSWSLAGSGKRLKSAVRKLVQLPADDDKRLQEEIAWQMAEMIVRDVTSVTLHGAADDAALTPLPL